MSGTNTTETPDNAQAVITIPTDNSDPVLTINTGITLDEGASLTINESALQVTDNEQTAENLTYTLTDLPNQGNLTLDGLELLINQTFTQADINNQLLSYSHDGSETIADSFSFTVFDGVDGNLPETTFAITINPVDDAPELVNPLPDITVDENSPETVIDLASVFTDAEGDNITISVIGNSNPDLVTPELIALPNGSNPKLYSFELFYEPNQSGKAEITIQAEANGKVATDTFDVTVNPIVPSVSFDIDGDGQYLAAVDGLLFYGYLNIRNLPPLLRDQLTGQLADNLIPDDSNATRTTGAEISNYLESNPNMMDIDGDGFISAAIDGLLAYGYFNIRNLPSEDLINSLTQQLVNNLIPDGSDATRTNGSQISGFLEGYMV